MLFFLLFVSENKPALSEGNSPGSEWISDWLNKSEVGKSPIGWTPSYDSKYDQASHAQVNIILTSETLAICHLSKQLSPS